VLVPQGREKGIPGRHDFCVFNKTLELTGGIWHCFIFISR
jgi:hypothetical protein